MDWSGKLWSAVHRSNCRIKNGSIWFRNRHDRHVMTFRFQRFVLRAIKMDSTTRQHDDKITSESTSNWIFLIPCHADSNCESKNRNRFNLIDPSTRQSTTHTKRVGIGPPKRSWLIGFCVFFRLGSSSFPDWSVWYSCAGFDMYWVNTEAAPKANDSSSEE